jgi:hypothetical protein
MCSGDSRDGVRGVRSLRMREREREREREEGGGKERPVTFEKFSMLYDLRKNINTTLDILNPMALSSIIKFH